MLKLINRTRFSKKITPAVSAIIALLLVGFFSSFNAKKHPYFLSVVDIKYNSGSGSLQISARMFTNDLEDALKKTSKKQIDILNPKNKSETDSVLFHYIKERLHISINSKLKSLKFIGYEKEDESIWTYLEISKVATPKKISVDTRLLYDFIPTQTNIVHIEINSVKKSSKVTNPDSRVDFSF